MKLFFKLFVIILFYKMSSLSAISSEVPPSLVTDLSKKIISHAIKNKKYECFFSENTRLPMMYMTDAIRATIQLMEAPSKKVKIRSSYNLAGVSFTPKETSKEISKHIFQMKYIYKNKNISK